MTPPDRVRKPGKRRRERDGIHSAVQSFLDEKLGAENANRRFVEAVVVHLTSATPDPSQVAVADQVVRIILSDYTTDSAALLVGRPELMASLFQNADLLDPREPASAELAKAVMKAMETLQEGQIEGS